MFRTLAGTSLVWLVVATLHVAAQEPAGTPGVTVVRAATARVSTPRILPGTRADVFATIQGNALTSTNGSLPAASVRLRDARIGQIVETQVTDSAGLFTFGSLDPGSYIVEIVGGQDQASVLAASQVLNVGAGEAVSAVVKLPFRIQPLAGILGNSTPSAVAITSQAAASGVLATRVSGTATCENLQ
jgi:hypothetical protein